MFQFYSCLDNDQFFISQPYSFQVLSRALHTTWNCPGVGTEESTDLRHGTDVRQKEMWYITEIKGSEGIREPTDSFCLWSIFCKLKRNGNHILILVTGLVQDRTKNSIFPGWPRLYANKMSRRYHWDNNL